jgi:4-hydroxy-tetrahydrodipicolinate reductase
MSSKSIKVVQVGLGALGRRLTPFLLERTGLQVVGAVDVDPRVVGRDLGEIAKLPGRVGIEVAASIDDALSETAADAAVLTTVSTLAQVRPQLDELVRRKLNVISSCEELCFPWQTAPQPSAEIDRGAKAAGVSVLGTGVNPGFLMDILPISLTAISRAVRKITVLRYQDARFRRLPFQQKIGAGLTLDQFEEKKAAGTLRHIGLTESMRMIASRIGWQLDRTEDVITPVIADREVSSEYITVKPGMARGVQQIGSGYVGGDERIRLEFRAALGEQDVQDTVIVEGEPDMRFTIPGGVNGDVATCAILTNAIPVAVEAAAGLRTMADIPPVSWFST